LTSIRWIPFSTVGTTTLFALLSKPLDALTFSKVFDLAPIDADESMDLLCCVTPINKDHKVSYGHDKHQMNIESTNQMKRIYIYIYTLIIAG
jgi:hypothetical protein